MEIRNSTKLSFLHQRDPSVDRRFRPRPERKVNLCKLYEEAPSTMAETSECLPEESAVVFLRMRPVPLGKFCPFFEIKGKELITHQPECSGKNILERHFSFNDIFDEKIDQSYIYNNCIRSKIESEEDMTVLAYGTSGSGKTFTLLGDLKNPGIIPRALENLFKIHEKNIYAQPSVKIVNGTLTILDDNCINHEESIRKTILSKTADVAQLHSVLEEAIETEHNFQVLDAPNKSVFIWISFAEIYNEIVFDLLDSDLSASVSKKKGLKIILNSDKVFIKNLTCVHVKNSLEAYKLLTYGLKKVTYASTAVNANSSRSHCIFFVDVITFSYPDIFTQKSYKFCDLAGSERLAKTQTVGKRLREAQRINTSLMVLGRCLDAAYNNQQKKTTDLIPFRESKLTFLLKSALTGKEKITMIVNVTPTEQYFEENLNVLGFASIAKNIVYKSPEKPCRTRYSLFLSHSSHVAPSSFQSVNDANESYQELLEENAQLRSKIEQLSSEVLSLKTQLVEKETQLRSELVDNFQQKLIEQNRLWEKRIAVQKDSLVKVYEAKMHSLEVRYQRQLNELECQDEDDSCYECEDEDDYCHVSLDEDLVMKTENL